MPHVLIVRFILHLVPFITLFLYHQGIPTKAPNSSSRFNSSMRCVGMTTRVYGSIAYKVVGVVLFFFLFLLFGLLEITVC